MTMKEKKEQDIKVHSKTIRVILSILIAFCVWLAAMLAAPEINKVIRGVPIEVDIPTSMALEVIDGDQTTVAVFLDGKQYEIGNYTNKDILVQADLSVVKGAGIYDVPLIVPESTNQKYTVSSINPSSVTMTFDNQMTNEFEIDIDISGLKIPKDYTSPHDEVVLEPSTVRVVGAQGVVSRIAKAVVEVSFDEEVRTTQKLKQEIVFYDANGRKVEVAGAPGVHPDATTCNITIPVKKMMRLPLTLSFLNTPNAFPLEQLSYTLSQETLWVAAEESEIKNYSELILGFVDFKQLNLAESSKMIFDVTLPEGFTNLDKVDSVEVIFDNPNIVSSPISLKNFKLINVPAGFDVTVNQSALRAEIVGSRSIMNGIVPGDFVMELDFAGVDLSPGKHEFPVSIYAPTKGFVWAVGDYSVMITVKTN